MNFKLKCYKLQNNIPIGVVDSSGFVFTYIDTPRQYDAGILFFGHGVSPSMIIPPNAHNFTTMGLCSDPCTRKVTKQYGRSYSI